VPPIHRLLCTHCTFGTSELEASTPENAGKVLGYSVRRSSLGDADRGQLRQLFRAVERLLSYALPKDATGAQKEELAADSAPRRLIFVPNLGGWQVAGQISYRSHDTAGRPGSYFADLIVERASDPRSRDAAPAWSAVEILRLWSTGRDRKTLAGAHWWISSEEQLVGLEADGPWKPAPLAAIADVRGSESPLIDDALLQRFLVAEAGAGEAVGDSLVPDRWCRMAAADRRGFVEAVLHAAILGPARGGRETVTIAAEPSVAAIVFYAVCRLLPAPIAAAVSFSTYEPSPERPLTGLVATTFIEEENPTADLPPELYQRGFACNTFRDLSNRGRAQAPPERGYVRHVVDLASRAAWGDLDDFLASLGAIEGLSPASLDGLTGLDHAVASYLRGDSAGQSQVRARSVEERFLRQRFRAAIEAEAGSRVDWPANILETAIIWFGEDLPAMWETSRPLHDVLERFLPPDGEALARLLSATPPVPRCVLSEAVVAAARRATPPAIPRAFTQYCRDCCSGAKQRRGEAANLVGEIVQMFPDSERRTLLLTTSSLAFTDLLLDAIRNLDAASCDRLGLPLSDMLHLVVSKSADKPSRVEELRTRLADFLDRHAGVSDRVSKSHDGLRAALRDLFTQLAAPDDGRQLAAERRSRVPGLRKWLDHVGPGTDIKAMFDCWEKLHKSAIDLADRAKEASARFGGALRGIPPEADASLGLAMSAIESLKPLDERVGGDGPRLRCRETRQALATRTFDALSIPVDSTAPPLKWVLEKIQAGLAPRIQGQQTHASPSRRKYIVWGSASVLVIVLGVVAYLFGDAYRRGTDRDVVDEKTGAALSPPLGKQSGKADPSASGRPANEDVPPRPPGPPPLAMSSPLEAKEIELLVRPHGDGKFAVFWNRERLEKTKLRLRWRRPVDSEYRDVGESQTVLDTKDGGFGSYSVRLDANPKDLPPVTATAEIEIPKPAAPDVERFELDVQDGKPRLSAKVTSPEPDAMKYGKTTSYELRGSGDADVIASGRRIDGKVVFDLPENLSPTTFLNATPPEFTIAIRTCQGTVSSSSSKPVSVHDTAAAIREKLKAKTVAEVSHVCPLPTDKGQERKLLDLPWSTPEKDFDLAVMTPAVLKAVTINPLEQDGASRWRCTANVRLSPRQGEAEGPQRVYLGAFEIRQHGKKNAWQKELWFKVTEAEASLDRPIAHEALTCCRLVFKLKNAVIGTCQLRDPKQMGPLEIKFPVPLSKPLILDNFPIPEPVDQAKFIVPSGSVESVGKNLTLAVGNEKNAQVLVLATPAADWKANAPIELQEGEMHVTDLQWAPAMPVKGKVKRRDVILKQIDKDIEKKKSQIAQRQQLLRTKQANKASFEKRVGEAGLSQQDKDSLKQGISQLDKEIADINGAIGEIERDCQTEDAKRVFADRAQLVAEATFIIANWQIVLDTAVVPEVTIPADSGGTQVILMRGLPGEKPRQFTERPLASPAPEVDEPPQ